MIGEAFESICEVVTLVLACLIAALILAGFATGFYYLISDRILGRNKGDNSTR